MVGYDLVELGWVGGEGWRLIGGRVCWRVFWRRNKEIPKDSEKYKRIQEVRRDKISRISGGPHWHLLYARLPQQERQGLAVERCVDSMLSGKVAANESVRNGYKGQSV